MLILGSKLNKQDILDIFYLKNLKLAYKFINESKKHKVFTMKNKSILFLSFCILMATGCDGQEKYPKMNHEKALKELTCKDCTIVKVNISKESQNCLKNKEVKFPIYLRVWGDNRLLSYGFLDLPVVEGNYTGSIKDSYSYESGAFDTFLWGKWQAIDTFGKAEINYNVNDNFIQLSAPSELIKNNRYSYIEKDIEGLLNSYCYYVKDYIEVNKDMHSWEKIKK